jgi:hypothetical protein
MIASITNMGYINYLAQNALKGMLDQQAQAFHTIKIISTFF